MWRVWERGGVCTGCWWGSLREGDHWGDPDVDGRIILSSIHFITILNYNVFYVKLPWDTNYLYSKFPRKKIRA
jgi:hypothetical protein